MGLYYLRARYYAPGTGRFWTMDTFEGSSEKTRILHKNVYAWDNTLKRIDPSGHDGDLISLEISVDIGASLDSMAGVADVGAESLAESTVEGAVESEEEAAALITDNGFQDVVTENLEGEAGENTELVEGQYKGGSGYSRPDILDKADKVMTEIKSVKSQSLTRQIQIQLSNVRSQAGWTYRMIFDASKNPTLSGPLKDALKQIGAKAYTTLDGKALTEIILN